MKCLALWVQHSRRKINWLSKSAKFLDSESANKLIRKCTFFVKFDLKPAPNKKYIGLKFLGTVDLVVPFQYSDLTVFLQHYPNEANIVNKDSPIQRETNEFQKV